MADVAANTLRAPLVVGDLTVKDDLSMSLSMIYHWQDYNRSSKNVVANILSKGTKLRDYTKGVENDLRKVELDSIQVAESKLAKFVVDIMVPPRVVDTLVDGTINEEYMRTLEILSKKLKFVEVDPLVKASKSLKDVHPELEKLRQKAFSKDPTYSPDNPVTVAEVEPLVKDFASRWKAAIELMQLSDCNKKIVGGLALNKDLVSNSISSIMYEIRKYTRTF